MNAQQQFVQGITLRRASGQRRDFCPLTAFLCLMDDHFQWFDLNILKLNVLH